MGEPLNSTRPYLLRAIHEWITDNGETPLVLVDATDADAQVPAEHIKDGRIILNIAWSATRNLEMTNEHVCFDARFSGAARAVSFPVNAVLSIYARESGQGMQFENELLAENTTDSTTKEDASSVTNADKPADNDDDRPKPRPGGPGLRLVK